MVLREIVLAGVADNKDYNCVLIKITRHAQRRSKICACGPTAEDSFHASEQTRHLKRLPIRNVNNLVDVFDVNVRWNDLLTNSLDEVRSGFNDLSRLFVSLKDRSIRIGADDFDTPIFLF